MNNLLKNWKTTSLGIAAFSASIIHLVFCIKNGTADEKAWEASVTGILFGLGLVFAGDASVSADSKDLANVQKQMAAVPDAIDSGNTEQLKKSITPTPVAVNPPQTK